MCLASTLELVIIRRKDWSRHGYLFSKSARSESELAATATDESVGFDSH